MALMEINGKKEIKMKTISYYELMEYKKQGMTNKEIGKIVGVTASCISQWVSSGRIRGNHRKNQNLKNVKKTVLLIEKVTYEKVKKKAKSENKFAYEVINDILKK